MRQHTFAYAHQIGIGRRERGVEVAAGRLRQHGGALGISHVDEHVDESVPFAGTAVLGM